LARASALIGRILNLQPAFLTALGGSATVRGPKR